MVREGTTISGMCANVLCSILAGGMTLAILESPAPKESSMQNGTAKSPTPVGPSTQILFCAIRRTRDQRPFTRRTLPFLSCDKRSSSLPFTLSSRIRPRPRPDDQARLLHLMFYVTPIPKCSEIAFSFCYLDC
jgi:hypothetical protein